MNLIDQESGLSPALFVDHHDDHLHCATFCFGILKDPIRQCPNGHISCRKCFMKWFKKSKSCPVCQHPVTSDMIQPASEIQEEMKKLKVRCRTGISNSNCDTWSGKCEWIGDFSEIENHQTTCGFEIISCNNNDCKERFLRQESTQHAETCQYRMKSCNWCHLDMQFRHIDNHSIHCDLRPVPCPNNCKDINNNQVIVSFQSLPSHLLECPLQPVPCKYAAYGCGVQVARKCITEHNNDDSSHIKILEAYITSLQNKYDVLARDHTELQSSIATMPTFLPPPPPPGRNIFSTLEPKKRGGASSEKFDKASNTTKPMSKVGKISSRSVSESQDAGAGGTFSMYRSDSASTEMTRLPLKADMQRRLRKWLYAYRERKPIMQRILSNVTIAAIIITVPTSIDDLTKIKGLNGVERGYLQHLYATIFSFLETNQLLHIYSQACPPILARTTSWTNPHHVSEPSTHVLTPASCSSGSGSGSPSAAAVTMSTQEIRRLSHSFRNRMKKDLKESV